MTMSGSDVIQMARDVKPASSSPIQIETSASSLPTYFGSTDTGCFSPAIRHEQLRTGDQ
jgi:hypothetical protein